MNHKIVVSLAALLLLLIFSCKKKSTLPNEEQIFVAPCVLDETVYDLDSVFYGASSVHPEAKYRVKFVDTTNAGAIRGRLEFMFNKVPTSGIYQMVFQIDTNNWNIPNQIAYVADSGSFLMRSADAELSEIYVEKNSDEIMISWCSMPDTTFYFDEISGSFVGNHPSKFKIKKVY